MMYSTYERISNAIGSNTLREEWGILLANDLCRPWNRRSLAGHLPYPEIHDVFAAVPDACARPGLYVFGSWAGAHARVHYVGIAHGKPLRARLCSRYLGERSSQTKATELSMAREFHAQFVRVEDDFSPVPPVNVEKYRQAGIRIPDRGRYRRLFRAERWAKIGFDNLWFFLIPAPPTVMKAQLESIETELILRSNAAMFELYSEGAAKAWPLVNVKHGNRPTNPHVAARQWREYSAWLSKRSRG